MFNLNKSDFNKYAMAFGPRAMQQGNFSAGARKFRLVKIDKHTSPRIYKIKESINSTYSDEEGDLYFLFACENRYSEPMTVNDNRTLQKMKEEKQCREDFIKCIYLKDINELNEKEEELAKKYSKIHIKISEYEANKNQSLIDNPEKRKKMLINMINVLSNLPLSIIESQYKDKNNSHFFEEFHTEDISKSNPFRFAVDREKLNKYGVDFDGNDGLDVYNTYILYSKSANYHKEVSSKGEIKLLEDSINKLENIENEKYDVNSYIIKKIDEIKDEKERKNMSWAWSIIKRLKLPLQYPSWVAIGWPQANTRRLELNGMNYGDNIKIKNIEELSFMDEESGRKMVWREGKMQPATGSGDLKLPVTPHTTLLQIIGKKPSESGHKKSVEYIQERLKNQLDAASRSKGKKRLELFNKAKFLRMTLSYYEMIRDNLNSFDHRDVNSFFYLYDEICNLYFSYNRDRYGDGIMLQSSAFYDNGNFKVISPKSGIIRGRTNRPFIPTTLHDDLREVIISVHYSYGTELPQFARTIFPGNSSLLLNKDILEKVLKKSIEKGLKKITVEGGNLIEKTIPVEELIDFFNKLSRGQVLVYRIENSIDPKSNNKSNIIWYAGLKSFSDRFDERSKVKRFVYDDSGKIETIEGYGRSRVSSGTAAISNDFKKQLLLMKSSGESKGNINAQQWDDVYVDDNLRGVYEYANYKWGLDYDYQKIENMVPKKIKSISPNIIKEMGDSYEDKVIYEINNQTETITITENTKDIIREIVTEISQESIEDERYRTVSIPSEKNIDISFEPDEDDFNKHKEYQISMGFTGEIAMDENEANSLINKGYVIEKTQNGLYKIIESPSWAKEV